jgi:hypothetical protein
MPTDAQNAKIQDVALRLGVPFEWLYKIISLESNFDPQARNPRSSARGLIQIIDDTAKMIFGMNAAALVSRYPDFDSQMDNVVYPFFKYYADRMGPYTSEEQFYLTVFLPAYRDKPLDWIVPDWVKKANPGVDTLQDYVTMALSRAPGTAGSGSGRSSNPPLPALLLVAAAGIALWYLYQHSKGLRLALPAY